MDEHQHRQQLCQAAAHLWTRGMAPGDSGVISLECHRRRYLVSPPGRRRSNLQSEELLVVNMSGEAVEGHVLPTGYWGPHGTAYHVNGRSTTKASPGIHAAIVVRPPMTLALLRRRADAKRIEIPDCDPLIVLDRADDEAALTEALAQTTTIALGPRQIMAVGPDLNAVLSALERVEHAALIELAAS